MRTLNRIFVWSDRPVIGGDIVDALVPAGWGPLVLMYSQSTSGSTQPGERPVTARSGNRATLHHGACGHCKGSVVCVYVTVLFASSWRRGVVVGGVRQWTKLTHVGPGYNWDGWPTLGGYTISGCNQPTKSTQPCIRPGSLNRVPASAGVKAGMSPLPGGR